MLSIETQNLGDITIFRCAGRIIGSDGGTLRNAVVRQSHARAAVLDLANVRAIDAAGLGSLLSLRMWAQTTDPQSLFPSACSSMDPATRASLK